MVKDIDLSYTHSGKYVPYLETCGLQGLELEYKWHTFFLATKTDTRLCFCTVIGLYHAHIRNGKNALYVEEYMGPRAPNANMKGMFFCFFVFSKQLN